jgi:PAS domain S-box-containing protein
MRESTNIVKPGGRIRTFATPDIGNGQKWLWIVLTLTSISIVAVIFGATEFIEDRYFPFAGQIPALRHYLFATRGVLSSMLLAFWATWVVLRNRRANEEELRRSREHYRGLLEASPNAVVLYDDKLHLNECNTATEHLYGLAPAELLGKRLPMVPPEGLAEFEGFAAQVRAGKPVLNAETKRRSKQGEAIDVQLSLLPFAESGQNYFLEITSDIRERVRLRETLLHVEKLTSMGQMAAGTAHHMNTPLASMLLRLRMMREGVFEGSLGDDLKRLEDNVHFCQRFVRRLLEFASHQQTQKQPENIGGTIEGVAGLLRPQLLANRLQLRVELGTVAAETILADRNHLEAVFLILLTNAMDASKPGGSIVVRGTSPTPEHILLEVSDEGCGINDTVLPHIFEPFYTTKPVGKGTGLGLAMAKNIVREHSGTIRVASTPGMGTTVYLEFPLCNEVPESRGVMA